MIEICDRDYNITEEMDGIDCYGAAYVFYKGVVCFGASHVADPLPLSWCNPENNPCVTDYIQCEDNSACSTVPVTVAPGSSNNCWLF